MVESTQLLLTKTPVTPRAGLSAGVAVSGAWLVMPPSKL